MHYCMLTAKGSRKSNHEGLSFILIQALLVSYFNRHLRVVAGLFNVILSNNDIHSFLGASRVMISDLNHILVDAQSTNSPRDLAAGKNDIAQSTLARYV